MQLKLSIRYQDTVRSLLNNYFLFCDSELEFLLSSRARSKIFIRYFNLSFSSCIFEILAASASFGPSPAIMSYFYKNKSINLILNVYFCSPIDRVVYFIYAGVSVISGQHTNTCSNIAWTRDYFKTKVCTNYAPLAALEFKVSRIETCLTYGNANFRYTNLTKF